jgi:hypothetical protein
MTKVKSVEILEESEGKMSGSILEVALANLEEE